MKPRIPMTVMAMTWLAAFPLTVAAQNVGGSSPNIASDDTEQQTVSRIRENLITLKLLRMTQALSLNQAQTAVIYPTLTRLENEKYDVTRKLSGVMGELRQLVKQDSPDEKKIQELIAAVGRLRSEILAKEAEMTEFMKSKLSIVQEAKYLLFTVEFYRVLGRRLESVRKISRGKLFTP
jgi:hypothetical protein